MQQNVEKVVSKRIVTAGGPVEGKRSKGHRAKRIGPGGVEESLDRGAGDDRIVKNVKLIIIGKIVE